MQHIKVSASTLALATQALVTSLAVQARNRRYRTFVVRRPGAGRRGRWEVRVVFEDTRPAVTPA